MSSIRNTEYANRRARRAHLAAEHAAKQLAKACTVRAIIYSGPHQDFAIEFGKAWETPHANWTIGGIVWFKTEADRAAWCRLWSASESSKWIPNQSAEQRKANQAFRLEAAKEMETIPHVCGGLYNAESN